MIEVAELRKEYGGFVAVEGSTFSVAPGEVFGIIGPNGAGKTTTLKMLAGLVEPTAGEATVADLDAGDPAMRQRLGFLPEESPLYEEMTPLSYLRFFADLYGVDRDTADERIERTLDRLDLVHRDRALGDVSKGMKRKVAIARSLVNDPDVLIYDEPASGLDPLTTNYIIDFTRDLADRGKTVVFSAHNLYHVESVCDRIAIMNEGTVAAQGTVPDLRERYGETEYHVYTTRRVDGADPREDGDGFVTVVDSMDAVDAVREQVRKRGGSVLDLRTVEPSLERVFLDLAERESATPAPSARATASEPVATTDTDGPTQGTE
ncbi:ABC transporter ATP-binding protein [Salinirubellus salinus]|uniref:ABC transporter ATP-binding protein n=1 Tax=Salinirubellus salinus TaxID=1364945 RepID=A0A9E7R4T6_9EURY|nr:ABC transporter ATP-binding protein [Salinirubellus salinus]UWM55881.1 ABC transporter ATP-binding protein [Salinirubellus salinus]